MSFVNLYDTLVKALQGNQINNLIIAGLVVVTVWVYREVRKSILENDNLNRQRLDKAIIAYSELEIMLLNNPRRNIDELSPKIAAAYPYFHDKMLRKVKTFLESKEDSAISNFTEALHNEIYRLKKLQNDPIVNISSGWFIDDLGYFLKQTKFSSFFQPILFLTLTFFLIVFLFLIAYRFDTLDVIGRVKFFLNLFALLSNAMVALGLGELLTENRFKHSKQNWVRLFFMVVLPIILWSELRNIWFAFIDLVLVWLYIMVFLKGSIIREELI